MSRLLTTEDIATSDTIETILGPIALLGRSRISAYVHALYGMPQTGVDQTAAILSRDPVLATRIIAVANTVQHGAGIAATRLDAAVVRLGHDRAKSLALIYEIGRVLAEHAAPDFTATWHRVVLRGCMARALAMNVSPRQAGVAFLAGTLLDIGTLLLAAAEPEAYEEIERRADGSPTRLAVLEWQSFNFNHLHVGARLLKHWCFPEEIIEAVGRHHTTPPAQATSDPGVRLWQCAYIAGALPIGEGRIAPGDALSLIRLLATAFNLQSSAVATLLSQSAAEYRDIAEAFRPMAPPTRNAEEMLLPAALALGVSPEAANESSMASPDPSRVQNEAPHRRMTHANATDRLPAFVAATH